MRTMLGKIGLGLLLAALGWVQAGPTSAHAFDALQGPSVVFPDRGGPRIMAGAVFRSDSPRLYLGHEYMGPVNMGRGNPGRDNIGRENYGRENYGYENSGQENLGHDRARQAMQDGEILPLSSIRHRVLEKFGGKIVGVELQEGRSLKEKSPLNEGGGRAQGAPPWVYDLRVLSPEGHVLFVQMDASDGRILDVRGRR